MHVGKINELELDTFTYEPTMGNDCADSKEALHEYASVKYRMNICKIRNEQLGITEEERQKGA